MTATRTARKPPAPPNLVSIARAAGATLSPDGLTAAFGPYRLRTRSHARMADRLRAQTADLFPAPAAEHGFLHAATAPGEFTAYLVYADYLDDRDDRPGRPRGADSGGRLVRRLPLPVYRRPGRPALG